MSTIQIILVVVGVVIAFGAYGQSIVNFFRPKKTAPVIVSQVNLPNDFNFPSVTAELIKVKETSTELSEIVIQWEKLTDMLISANMKDSAKELKGVLVHMAKEYKQETTPLVSVAPVKKETNLFAIQSLMSN